MTDQITTDPNQTGIPSSPEAEKGFLSSLMQAPELASEVAETVDATWFHSEGRQTIFAALLERSAAGIQNPGDLIGLTTLLRDQGTLERAGGPGELAELLSFAPSAAYWQHYHDVLRDKRARRALVQTANEMLANAYDTEGSISELLANAEAAVQEVSDAFQDAQGSKEQDGEKPLAATLHGLIGEFEERFERHSKGTLSGLSTGLADLDRITHGLQAGRVYLFGARPKNGKSSLLRQILLHVSKTSPVLLHSLEMSKEQTVEAMLVREGLLNADDIAAGSFHEKHDLPAIMQACGKLMDRRIFVESRAITIHQLVASARRHHRRHKIGLLALDYIQRLRPHDPRQDARANISYASRMLADLAIQLEIPIIVVAQLNRDAENVTADRLHQGHLKECGALEEDAAFIGLLGPMNEDQDEYQNPVPGKAATGVRTIGLNVVAQRFGPTGLLKFVFRGNHYQFGDTAKTKEINE